MKTPKRRSTRARRRSALSFTKAVPRYVDPDTVGSWIGLIPSGIWKVGVFVDESREIVEQIGADLDLDIAQLHGAETPRNYPRRIRVWKAIRITEAVSPFANYPAEALLLDGPRSGETCDWSLAANVPGKVILAGGLTPENVREAIGKTQPMGRGYVVRASNRRPATRTTQG